MCPPALGHPNDQIPSFLFAYKKEGNALGILTQKHGDHHRPRVLQAATGPCGTGTPPCLRAITATALLVKAIGKTAVGSPLTISVPHAVEAPLNSHHTQHISASCLTSYEILGVDCSSHNFSCCNNLNPATLLPSVANEAPADCLTLMHHLLTPRDNLQETPLSNADSSWFPDDR